MHQKGRGSSLARRLLGAFVLLALLGMLFVAVASLTAGLSVYAFYAQKIPAYSQMTADWKQHASAEAKTSIIYAWRDDQLSQPVPIYQISNPAGENPSWTTLDQTPQALQDATVAFEDPDFYAGQALNTTDLIRQLLAYFRGQEQGGARGSILRQLVRKQYIRSEESDANGPITLAGTLLQVEELLLSHRISNSYTQDQILEWYLNTAFYGNLAFGVNAASHAYFGKPVSELGLAEAAMLSAIPGEPTLNPTDDLQAAKDRQRLVLEAMADAGLISRDSVAAAQFTPIQFTPGMEDRLDIIAPHFALYVREELEERFGPELLLYGGLRVYTSLNLEMQHQAECLARAQVNRLSGQLGTGLPADERDACEALAYLSPLPGAAQGIDRNVGNAAVVMLDAESAGIRAMVGNLNYWNEAEDGAFNIATQSERQPGTALKPFIYLTALSRGYTAATMVLDVETDFSSATTGSIEIPQNADGQFHGPMRLREALGNGYYVPAIQVMSWVGVNNVLRTAHSLGITGLNDALGSYDLSLALGGGKVNLLDMVFAFNVMNNMGVMIGHSRPNAMPEPGMRTIDPVSILRVENSAGELLYEYHQDERREILTPQLAYMINDMLSDRSARCANFGCPNVMELPDNRPAAVTTGTTNDFRDAWAVGYTPQLVTGVWVGNSDNSDMMGVSGEEGAAPIWQALMSWSMNNEPVAVWSQPPNLREMAVCNISGLLATPYCPTLSELFIDGTQPTVYDNIYQPFAINRETGRLATIYTPPDLVERKIYKIYPEQASAWAEANQVEHPPTDYDTISRVNTDLGAAAISSPQPFSFIRGTVPISGTAAGDNFSHFRLAHFMGLTPSNLQTITEISSPVENELLATWDVGNLSGLYTLLLTVVNKDGSFSEASVPLTVDNQPPTISIETPLPNQRIAAGSENVLISVDVEDNISVVQVAYYLDGARLPFAASITAPFSTQWAIRAAGCHSLTAVAIDAAGNETVSPSVPVCLVEPE